MIELIQSNIISVIGAGNKQKINFNLSFGGDWASRRKQPSNSFHFSLRMRNEMNVAGVDCWGRHQGNSPAAAQPTKQIKRNLISFICWWLAAGCCSCGGGCLCFSLLSFNQSINSTKLIDDCWRKRESKQPGLPALIHKSTNQFKQIKLNLIWLIDVDFEWLAHPPLLYWLRSARHMPQRAPNARSKSNQNQSSH